VWFAAVVSLATQGSHAADYTIHAFKKIQLTDKFWAEGVAIGDINRDGHTDLISGPSWYEGPDFRKRHQFYPATQTFLRRGANGKPQVIRGFEGALGKKTSYSNNFFTFVYDLNRDGWPDILTIGFPGTAAIWYENPGNEGLKSGALWNAHVAFDTVDNESPTFADLLGDGRPVLLCMSGGFIGYAAPDPDNPTNKWTFHPISPKGDYQRLHTVLATATLTATVAPIFSRPTGGGSSQLQWSVTPCGGFTNSPSTWEAPKSRPMGARRCTPMTSTETACLM